MSSFEGSQVLGASAEDAIATRAGVEELGRRAGRDGAWSSTYAHKDLLGMQGLAPFHGATLLAALLQPEHRVQGELLGLVDLALAAETAEGLRARQRVGCTSAGR